VLKQSECTFRKGLPTANFVNVELSTDPKSRLQRAAQLQVAPPSAHGSPLSIRFDCGTCSRHPQFLHHCTQCTSFRINDRKRRAAHAVQLYSYQTSSGNHVAQVDCTCTTHCITTSYPAFYSLIALLSPLPLYSDGLKGIFCILSQRMKLFLDRKSS
jgi:hypothetical protein